MADRQRYWLIWVDDTPTGTETPLTANQAAEAFTHEAAADPAAIVEVKQCTREDLNWAGAHYTDGIGRDEMDEDS